MSYGAHSDLVPNVRIAVVEKARFRDKEERFRDKASCGYSSSQNASSPPPPQE